MTFNIIKGGQNAWPPLYRDGNTVDPCQGAGDDPNAPEIYYWGMGLAWEKGKTLSSPDGEHANIEGVLVTDDYDAWSPMADITTEEVPEEDFDFMGAIMRSIWRGCKDEYRLNNVPAVVRSAAIIMQVSAEEFDLEENPLVIGTMVNFLIGITASPLSGTVKLNDDSTLPVTITMMEDAGDFGGAALIETLEPVDLAGRKIVDLVYDAPFAYAQTDKVIDADDVFDFDDEDIAITHPQEGTTVDTALVSPITGTAEPSSTLVVTTSWDGSENINVDENGAWELVLNDNVPVGNQWIEVQYIEGGGVLTVHFEVTE